VGGIMYNDKFNHIADMIKDLGKSCEQLGIQYTTKLSTLEVAVSQQVIQIKKLQEELDSMTQIVDEQVLEIKNLQEEHTLTDESLILQYTGGTTTPVPYPYTNPIREVPEYSRIIATSFKALTSKGEE
jgi:hypothetical protein